MYFTSAHNKKEHMFGRQHLQNISGEIRRQSTEKNKQKQAELFDTTEYSDSEQTMSDGPVDIQGFINSFRAQNHGITVFGYSGFIRFCRKSIFMHFK